MQKKINKNITKLSFKLSLLLLLCLGPIQQIKSANYNSNLNIKNILTCTGILAGGVGLFFLYDYLFAKTDQQIIDSSNNSFRSAINHDVTAKMLLKVFKQQLSFIDFAKADERRRALDYIANNIDQIALNINGSIDDYLYKLNNIISDLKYNVNLINKRLPNMRDSVALVIDLSRQMEQVTLDLEFLHAYIKNHKAYFNLYKLGREIAELFEGEFRIFAQYPYDMASQSLKNELLLELKKYAVIKYRNSNAYPYLTYIENIDNKLSLINKHKCLLRYKYSSLLSEIGKFEYMLTYIRDSIIFDREYVEEKRTFDREQKEHEKLSTERALREREVAARESIAQSKQIEAQARLKQTDILQAKLVLDTLKS